MGLIQDVTQVLRDGGFTVQARGRGPGSPEGVTGVEMAVTGSGTGFEVAPDMNGTVLPAGGVAYVQRDGTVWLLGEGPTRGSIAQVWVAATSKRAVTPDQRKAVQALTEALTVAFGLTSENETASDAGDDDLDQSTDQ